MPGDKPAPVVCPHCGFLFSLPAGLDCERPQGHGVQRPGKGFHPPYMRPLAEAVTDLTEEDEEGEKGPYR